MKDRLKQVDPGMWLKLQERKKKYLMTQKQLEDINPALRVFFNVKGKLPKYRESIRQDMIDIIDWSKGVNSL